MENVRTLFGLTHLNQAKSTMFSHSKQSIVQIVIEACYVRFVLTFFLTKHKVKSNTFVAVEREAGISETEVVLFLKTLIISSSTFAKKSSELNSTRSELITTSSELNSTRLE